MQQRLFEITYLLTERGSMTAAQLAERFGVSRRTIYRDIEALSMAGIPVYSEKGRGGGIRMMPEYVLDRAMFTQNEQSLLVNQLQSLSALNTPEASSAYEKLTAQFGQRQPWLDVDFGPWSAPDDTRGLFALLRDAIHQYQVVEFSYTGGVGGVTQRRACPLRLLFRGQAWYLYAYCLLREDFRVFKLTRLQHCRLAGEGFAPLPSIPEPPGLAMPAGRLLRLVLVFDASVAFRVYDEYPARSIELLPDGRLRVECELPDDGWTKYHLLTYGPSLRVESPDSLRAELRTMLEKTLEKYQ